MSLYQRIKRRLGYDTTTTKTDTRYLYEYTVTHLNGETTTVVASNYTTDGAFAKFQKVSGVHPVLGFDGGIAGIWALYEEVRVLEGIQEIEEERVGQSELEAVVDLADGSVVDSEVRHGCEG